MVQRLVTGHRRVTIGRKADSDLIINAPGVSAEHAVINRTPDHFFYEDLDSTNGSRINGERVDYGMLYDGDVIEFGRYTIEFVMQDAAQIGLLEEGDGDHQAAPVDFRQAPVPLPDIAPTDRPTAFVRILNGLSAGREYVLDKPLTTIGYPPRHIATLMTSPTGYVFAHVEGDAPSMVNGVAVTASHPLAEGDVIRMGEVEAIFLLDPWYAHRP